MVHPRQSQILQALWRDGQLSQSQIHARLGIRKNTICEDVEQLQSLGLICVAGTEHLARGRPRTSLEIDPQRRSVMGVSIEPGRVELAALNLLGQPIATTESRSARSSGEVIRVARELIAAHASEQTLAIGLSAPGLIDPVEHRVLLSSMDSGVDLEPLYRAAARVPLIVQNDVHAMAARWLQSRGPEQDETILLVFLDDGRLGAALLVEGHPPASAILGAHELGHTRLHVDTPLCYCGHRGCMERIGSSAFLERNDSPARSLHEHAEAYDGSDARMNEMLDLLGLGFANAINLLRPHRLVLASPLVRCERFIGRLIQTMREQTLSEFSKRLRIDDWDQPASQSGETAAWLALTALYRPAWRGSSISASSSNGADHGP